MSNRQAVATRGTHTRAKILAACLRLFNERGPGKVTTAEIAASVGINEGNLYYHFQRKEQIVEALFADYAAAATTVAVSYQGDAPARDGSYLAAWFNLMWEWRFFYRDGFAVLQMAPTLRPRLKALSAETQTQVRRATETMVEAKLLRATPDEIDHLIVNAWIVSTYWIDYLRTSRGVTRIKRQHIDWGMAQMQSLFAPYLTAEGRAMIKDAAAPSLN